MTKCILYGHTGAVGEWVLKEVMANPFFTKVTTLGRRKIEYQGDFKEKLNQVVVDFENIQPHRDSVKDVNVVFCTLGTTRREAGSAEQFWKIDHDYVINTAKFIQEVNQPTLHTSHLHFLYCSAQGANLESKFLYPKCKGTIEKELSELGFPYVSIVRPGLIEIDKTRAHGARWMESLALHLLPLFKWMAPQSISCPASTIAKAMVQLAIHPPPTSSTATTTTTSNSMTMNAATTQTTTSSIFTIFDNRKIYELANEMK